jgi:hypothetical protein
VQVKKPLWLMSGLKKSDSNTMLIEVCTELAECEIKVQSDIFNHDVRFNNFLRCWSGKER